MIRSAGSGASAAGMAERAGVEPTVGAPEHGLGGARQARPGGDRPPPISAPSDGAAGGNRQPEGLATGPVGAMACHRRILRNHRAPDPAVAAGLLGSGVIGAVGAPARPAGEAHSEAPLRISSILVAIVADPHLPPSLFIVAQVSMVAPGGGHWRAAPRPRASPSTALQTICSAGMVRGWGSSAPSAALPLPCGIGAAVGPIRGSRAGAASAAARVAVKRPLRLGDAVV